MERTLTIDDREITFKATAKTPLLYKQLLGKDLLKDIQRVQGNTTDDAALEVFSNLAYVMAWQADPDIPDLDDWLDSFGMFSLYTALPQLSDMWNAEMKTTVVSKKKASKAKGK